MEISWDLKLKFKEFCCVVFKEKKCRTNENNNLN